MIKLRDLDIFFWVLTKHKYYIFCFVLSDSWDIERSKLGNSVSGWNSDSKVSENFRVCGSRMVLSPCFLSGVCVCYWGCWVGNWYQARKWKQGSSVYWSSQHRDCSLCSCNIAGNFLPSNALCLWERGFELKLFFLVAASPFLLVIWADPFPCSLRWNTNEGLLQCNEFWIYEIDYW